MISGRLPSYAWSAYPPIAIPALNTNSIYGKMVNRDELAPIPIILNCPGCCIRHIDEGEWASKPHHTHSCQFCGVTWRPAVVNTVGVLFLPGFKSPTPEQKLREQVRDGVAHERKQEEEIEQLKGLLADARAMLTVKRTRKRAVPAGKKAGAR